MPYELLISLICAYIIIFGSALCVQYSSLGTTDGCVLFFIILIPGVWWAIVGYNSPPAEYIPLKVNTVIATDRSYDVTAYGKEVVNLNTKFGRDFNDGDIIYHKKYPTHAGFIYVDELVLEKGE